MNPEHLNLFCDAFKYCGRVDIEITIKVLEQVNEIARLANDSSGLYASGKIIRFVNSLSEEEFDAVLFAFELLGVSDGFCKRILSQRS